MAAEVAPAEVAVRGLSAAAILAVWDEASALHPVRRSLVLLAGATGWPADELATLSAGTRDALLLAVRAATFGPTVRGLARCPSCHELVETSFAVAELLAVTGPPPAAAPDGDLAGTAGASRGTVTAAGYRVDYRAPDSEDLLAAALAGPQRARSVLLARCLTALDPAGHPVAVAGLPTAVIDAAVTALADDDPGGDLTLRLDCPSCAAPCDIPFDAGRFLWSEIDAWSRRRLLDVHQLASAYGWSEADILALGDRRRQEYLDLVGQVAS